MADEAGNSTKQAGGKTRERSPNYPAYTLTDSIALAQKVYDAEKRTAVPAVVIAKAIGYSTLNGKARTCIASLRQYGLIEGSDSGLRLSDTAMEILHQPAGSPERTLSMQTAAKNPPLIAELLASHGEASDDALRALLVTKKKFSVDGAGRFIASFRDAVRHADDIQDDYNPVSGGDERKPPNNPPAGGGKAPPPTTKPGEHMEFTFQLSGDAVATLTVSRGIDADDVDTLDAYFGTVKKALLKAAAASATAQQVAAASAAQG